LSTQIDCESGTETNIYKSSDNQGNNKKVNSCKRILNFPLLGELEKLWKATIDFVISVHPSVRLSVRPSPWNSLAPMGRIFFKFYIWVFFEILSRKFKFHSNRTRITGTLREDQYTFLIISRPLFLEWEMFQTKVVEKIKTHILCTVTLSRKSFRFWDKMEKIF